MWTHARVPAQTAAGRGRCRSSGLVVVIRILLIPLFVKQIKAQRGLQILQPEIKAMQKRYKDDRQKQSEEMMKLYRETGTNPFSSCLPIILQMPIFFALFHVLQLRRAARNPIGAMTAELVESAHDATIFGAPISATFLDQPPGRTPGADRSNVRIVTIVLIALMTLTTFITQKQLLVKGIPNAEDNPISEAAEDPGLRLSLDVRGVRHQLPDRCAVLLAHHQPLVHGPAVLRDPQQSRARQPGADAAWEARQARKAARKAGADGARRVSWRQRRHQTRSPAAPAAQTSAAKPAQGRGKADRPGAESGDPTDSK